MRIFLSHSSRIKPLVREVRGHLPQHVNAWIDEQELLVGASLERTIREAIQSSCDFLIVFLDESVVGSEWVNKELEWARQEEERLGRPFILPVLIDQIDLGRLEWLQDRVYLKCHGFSEADIANLAAELSASLFAWLSRDVERLQRPPETVSSDLTLLEQADSLLRAAAETIRSIVLPHRKSNPMRLTALHDQLVANGQVPLSSPDDLHDLLFRLGERRLLSGITIAGGKIYVEEEHLSWRLQESVAAKRAIAEFASEWINDGNVVFIDGGSTTLQVAMNVCRNLRFKAWNSLTVVTNSPPVAAEFANLANELGYDDHDPHLQLYMVGGRMRMNAATIVRMPGGTSTIPDVATHLGGFDIALCGTNGIHWPGGCTTTAKSQAEGKHLALSAARRRVILADSSKYGVQQEEIFASFDMGLEILTAPDSQRLAVEDFAKHLTDSGSKIVLTS